MEIARTAAFLAIAGVGRCVFRLAYAKFKSVRGGDTVRDTSRHVPIDFVALRRVSVFERILSAEIEARRVFQHRRISGRIRERCREWRGEMCL